MNKDLKNRFINLDTPVISDAMDSLNLYGSIAKIKSRVSKAKVVGPVFTVKYRSFARENGNFYNAGNYIDEVPSGSVLLIDNEGKTDCTNWGDILTQMALQKKIAGTVLYGAARDITFIREQSYPLFSSGITMVSGKNRVRITGTGISLVIEGVTIAPTDWLFADDNGVIALPFDYLEEILERAEQIEQTEGKIREAIAQGVSLEKARSDFGYSQPWVQHT